MNQEIFDRIQAHERESRIDARAFARAFATPDGQRALAVLERELGWNQPSSIGVEGRGVDINATLIRDGQKVAIKFIHDMRAAGARVAVDDEAGKSIEYTPQQQ